MIARYRTMQQAVAKFQEAFSRPTNMNFSDWTFNVDVADMLQLRETLIEEEFIELCMALRKGDEQQAKKEAADLLYVVTGLFVDFGWNMEVIFNRVHNSNMSKLGKDGKPVYRDDGKIMKSDQYEEPDLSDV
jgi:predicted HAD superfamily Cof-like phosphohydrolase